MPEKAGWSATVLLFAGGLNFFTLQASRPEIAFGQTAAPSVAGESEGPSLEPPLTYETPAQGLSLSPSLSPRPPRSPSSLARSMESTTSEGLPARPERAPFVAQDYDWSGGYAGIQIGGGIGTSRRDFTSAGTTTNPFEVDGPIGGMTAGYNHQFGNNLVIGLEGDFSINSLTGSANRPNRIFRYTTENPLLITLRQRLGYDFGSLFPYVTGGLALGNVRVSSYTESAGALGSDFVRTEPGWTAGAGIETALSASWSVKVEYLYLELNNAEGPSSTGSPSSTSFNEHIGRVGLSYRFDHPNQQSSEATSVSAVSKSSDSLISLGTLSGIELGGEISYYRYQESVSGSSDIADQTGVKLGIMTAATKSFHQDIFVSGDFRLAYSRNHYSSEGTGTQDNIPDYLWEIRLLAGKDFLLNNAFSSHEDLGISPYIGVGYRNLFNDLRGTSSTGAHGYRRESQYLYLPVGVTPRFRITKHARISTNVEYDQLVEGLQRSYLSDASPGAPDVTNGQFYGYGLRVNVLFEEVSWSTGPFFNFWDIDKSGGARIGNGVGYEPHNQTIEIGFQVRVRF